MPLTTFPPAVAEALAFYVYRLVDPRDGATFYVGKGRGDRALSHARDALDATIESDRLDVIRTIHAAGREVGVVIHRHGMDEKTALEVEAALIDAYPGLRNLIRGHGAVYGPATAEALVDRYAAPPAVFPDDFRGIIIKIERQWVDGMSEEQLYERTRRYWKCNPDRYRPAPTHAIAVSRGLIREIYRIEEWEEYKSWPEDRDMTRILDAEDDWKEGEVRRGFVGAPDPSMAHLRRSSVRHLTRPGTQNPITYVGYPRRQRRQTAEPLPLGGV